jgi:hypothetical protein
MMEAERLHREVALLSNKLHTFADNDLDGIKPLIAEILSKREQWKKIRMKIKHFDEFGFFPEERQKDTRKELSECASEAEIQVQLNKCQILVRQLRHKIKNQPDATNHQRWKDDLAKEEMKEKLLQSQLLEYKYAN